MTTEHLDTRYLLLEEDGYMTERLYRVELAGHVIAYVHHPLHRIDHHQLMCVDRS